jgi:hypothetical protein
MTETSLSMEDWDLLNNAAGNGGMTLAEWDEVDRLLEDELVTVTIRIPEQFFDYSLPRTEWEAAEDKALLLDLYIDDMPIREELYGPDGQQVGAW